jgi:hypothetical protein
MDVIPCEKETEFEKKIFFDTLINYFIQNKNYKNYSNKVVIKNFIVNVYKTILLIPKNYILYRLDSITIKN